MKKLIKLLKEMVQTSQNIMTVIQDPTWKKEISTFEFKRQSQFEGK